MKRYLLAVVLSGTALSASAASLSSTATLASDYLFDGVSQTQDDPALQISLDAAWESGFYLGVWGSNVDFGDGDPADLEIDFYGGYSRAFGEGMSFDIGLARYTYAGAPADYDYTEYYAGLTFPTGTSLKAWFSDDEVLGGKAWRVKAKHSIALPNEFSLDLEATRTQYSGAGWEDFTHGQIGISRAFGDITAYLGYSDTTLDDNPRADGRVLMTLSTSFDIL